LHATFLDYRLDPPSVKSGREGGNLFENISLVSYLAKTSTHGTVFWLIEKNPAVIQSVRKGAFADKRSFLPL